MNFEKTLILTSLPSNLHTRNYPEDTIFLEIEAYVIKLRSGKLYPTLNQPSYSNQEFILMKHAVLPSGLSINKSEIEYFSLKKLMVIHRTVKIISNEGYKTSEELVILDPGEHYKGIKIEPAKGVGNCNVDYESVESLKNRLGGFQVLNHAIWRS